MQVRKRRTGPSFDGVCVCVCGCVCVYALPW